MLLKILKKFNIRQLLPYLTIGAVIILFFVVILLSSASKSDKVTAPYIPEYHNTDTEKEQQATLAPNAEDTIEKEDEKSTADTGFKSENETDEDIADGGNKTPPSAAVSNNDKSDNPTDQKTQDNATQNEVTPSPAETGTEQTDTAAERGEYTCTISISCAAVFENPELIDKSKVEILPEDGFILPSTTVSFEAGESVFDLLKRITRENRIHLEFTNTPLYNSAYVEGIGNLYALDCGALSGWTYKVNGAFLNIGASKYIVAEGDVIEWVYTCDFVSTVGGGS